ncbi:propanediol utilization phosphotransacylase [candidate division SR1 bacterium]|nr:propanediol utilization phosphotransacylase [candidate division SR1 bacterium]
MRVPISISGRHSHLSEADANTLFGSGYQFSQMKDLSQPGQYVCEETITIQGDKGSIDRVRVLGPFRKFTQVEILQSDTFKLGVKAPIRESGNLEGSGKITLIGPKGTVQLNQGLIVAQRHIHLSVAEAKDYGVSNGEIVSVKTLGERSLVFNNVVVRANDSYALDMHVDMDEANAAGLGAGAWGEIIK